MPVITISENSGADFSGVTDVKIRSAQNTGNFNTQGLGVSKWATGDHELSLLRFDVTVIAGPITVNSATLRINATNAFNVSSQTISVYELLRPFVDSQATWDIFSTGNNWQTGGARGALDRGASPLATLSGITAPFGFLDWTGSALNALVQSLVNTATVLNVTVDRDDAGDDSSFIAFGDSEATDGVRPELTIDYTVGGGGGNAAAVWHYYQQFRRR